MLNGAEVTISWTPAADDGADRYILRRSRNGGNPLWAGRVDAPGTSIIDTPNGAGTYTYFVESQAGGTPSSQTPCGQVTI